MKWNMKLPIQKKLLTILLPGIIFIFIIVLAGNLLILNHALNRIVENTLFNVLDKIYVQVSNQNSDSTQSLTIEEKKSRILKNIKNMQSTDGNIQPVVFTGEGQILIHPHLFIGTDISHHNYFSEIKEKPLGLITITQDISEIEKPGIWQQDLILVYKYFKPWDWYIALIGYASFYSTIKVMISVFILIISILSIIFIIFLTYFITSKITKPISVLTEAADAIAVGNFDLQIDLATGDEFEKLGNAFKQMSNELEESFNKIENQYLDIKNAHNKVKESKEALHKTLTQLNQSEKMAAIGAMVGGITHDVNTPVGIGMSAAYHLKQQVEEISRLMNSGELKRSDLVSFLDKAKESVEITYINLQRAADLIQSFKKIAVDQGSEEQRQFHLKNYLDDIFLSLQPKLKKNNHTININCPDDLLIVSIPGAFSQIITNLIMNSIIHGFEDTYSGTIVLNIFLTDYDNTHSHKTSDISYESTLVLDYNDNGKGISEDDLEKLFDPFFTTKRESGGSGLGTHIIYNIVTQSLNGTITCTSELQVGTKFHITIPLEK
jgi:signal transduction histidine kinase